MEFSSDEERYFSRRKQRIQQEQQQQQLARPRNKWGGSKKGKAPNIDRDRGNYHELLMKDYFVDNPIYDSKTFRRRFRMHRELFERIKQDLLQEHNNVWAQLQDPCGVKGFSTEQKMTGCLRVLAYGTAADSFDEYIRMAESTLLEYLELFCDAIISMYSSFYLRKPTAEDLQYILSLHSSRGFPGKLGSLDVMHWEWKNCPMGWAGQYQSGKNVLIVCLTCIFILLLLTILSFALVHGNNR
jgi:hypothetical protein